MMITEWGPYDFRYPIIWNLNPVDSGKLMKFLVAGPEGRWKVRSFRGIKNLSAMGGRFPDTLTAERVDAERTDIFIELEYTGAAFTNAFGEQVPAQKKHIFSFRKFFQPIQWNVLWYAIDTSVHNPISTGQLFSPVERKAPVKEERTARLDYAWWGGIRGREELHKQFVTAADGEGVFLEGDYEISVTWDDAVRIYIDEKQIINEWNPSLYTFDESPNRKVRMKLGGLHRIRVEHVELGGFACLSLKFKLLP
jgi:hypothetical protein